MESSRLVVLAVVLGISLVSQACTETPGLPQPPAASGDPLYGIPHQEISLTRTGCFGPCPVYTVIYRRDGTVSYSGRMYVDHMGERAGRIALSDFAALARFLEQAKFEDLEDDYRVGVTDQATITVRVTHVDGHSKSVAEYGLSGPPGLWAVQRVIDGLLVQTEWDDQIEK